MRPIGSSRHLDTRTGLDYLEFRMDAAGRRAVEEHLGRDCVTCRNLVRELGWLTERMRLDRIPEVPEALHARAVAVFEAYSPRGAVERVASGLAILHFDTSDQAFGRARPSGRSHSSGGMR